ncbi:NAD(P)H-hydrate dehydratase [bacterium]|nr:NAD(P)H-hydrate dehydratase [bacterium]
MQPLVTSSQMQEIDRRTISELGLPDLLLMEHAALGVVKALESRFRNRLSETRGIILAGTGNNGGDALAVARILDSLGLKKIFVGLVGDEKKLSKSTQTQKEVLGRLGIPIFWPDKPDQELFEACDWIIDGFFGTGLSREIQSPYKKWIETINTFYGKKWIISIDVPSGLDSDTGHPLGISVMASQTVTLGFIKRGLVTGSAADYVGQLNLEPIQIPRIIPFSVDTFLYGSEDAKKLPKRRPTSHKGSFGHVYVWASEESTQGACILASLGALRTGAGLVSVVGESSNLKDLRQRLPAEVMTEVISEKMFEKTQGVWVQGPGMGDQDANLTSFNYLEKAIMNQWKCVLDADALNLIAKNKKKILPMFKKARPDQIILTPHPKEASRLLHWEVAEVEKDRYATVRALAETYGASVVLKGKGTLIQIPGQPCVVVATGDTGLSKGGTGDLLAGMIGAFLAQGLPSEMGVPLGVYLHGRVSERVTQVYGQPRSTIVSDLALQIPQVLRELEPA